MGRTGTIRFSTGFGGAGSLDAGRGSPEAVARRSLGSAAGRSPAAMPPTRWGLPGRLGPDSRRRAERRPPPRCAKSFILTAGHPAVSLFAPTRSMCAEDRTVSLRAVPRILRSAAPRGGTSPLGAGPGAPPAAAAPAAFGGPSVRHAGKVEHIDPAAGLLLLDQLVRQGRHDRRLIHVADDTPVVTAHRRHTWDT